MVHSAVANFILEKMALNDKEITRNIQRQTEGKLNKNDVKIESSRKNDNSEGETARFNSNDPEPMEAHKSEQSAQAEYGEVIDLIIIVV